MTDIPALQPLDEHNRTLQSLVHPPDWVNPTPAGRYNLVVIGAGTAGLVSAAVAAGLGAKVALVERELMGGDCLNVGCVPSKALIRAARVAAMVREAGQFGIRAGECMVDFPAVMERMRRLRAGIAPLDSAARFRDLGVDVFLGEGRFESAETISVGGQTLHFKRAVIATGARAAAPPIEGIDSVEYLTNETLFSLTELPASLAVIGAGPIGCEMAQAFARFGSEVTLIEAEHGVLPKEDRDPAAIVQQALEAEGVRLLCCGKNLKLAPAENGRIRVSVRSHDESHEFNVDRLLVSVGRRPNVSGMGLEAAGVTFDERTGIQVDDTLRTSNRRIYAAGDVCSKYQFTHAADFMARSVVQNALFPFPKAKLSRLIIPWCTYTSPEIAHVGLSEADAQREGTPIDTWTQSLEHVDRAILDGQTDGVVRIHTRRGSDTIVGATIVADHAGDLIAEVVMAMKHGIGLSKLAGVIHPYPTQADAVRKTGDAYNRTRLTDFKAGLLKRFFAWQR
jgi:pyruvate/2-oxoglutarate dehydrogenase complex dihydrolipoamide dehydrogenase (E3) component